MSEAAEQLEAMAAEVKIDKRNIIDIIQKIENHVSGQQDGARQETELNIYKSAKNWFGVQLHRKSPLPLHPTSIKLESGCISQP